MVRLVKAENLPARDGTTSDPFAVFTFNKAKKQQSWIIYKTLDPSWNQKFEWYDVSRCTLPRAESTPNELLSQPCQRRQYVLL